ncbi:MAG: hypothetical protein WC179_09710, partial [Candidatus Cloacimonadaceae bacterium]
RNNTSITNGRRTHTSSRGCTINSIIRRSIMYKFVYNMWIMKRITDEQVQAYADKGILTQEEVDAILSTPQP